VLLVDENARVLNDSRNRPGFISGPRSANEPDRANKPSDETLLHVRIAQERGAGAVLHTHSIWNTIASDLHGDERGVRIEGYEMLKGLAGVRTHQHSEWLPIVDNSQDMPSLAEQVSKTLHEHKAAHGFLIKRHGLYSWGDDLAQAKRHVEILEFLLETMGRTATLKSRKS
jgi:methylthioribulose-1-phosphate dehydratase